jgi:hypothetical protein
MHFLGWGKSALLFALLVFRGETPPTMQQFKNAPLNDHI